MRKKLLLVAGLALVSLPVAAYAAVLAPGPHSSFTVRGANIQDPLGHRFIVRGAVIAPGALTDPQGTIDAKALAGVKHDAQVLASMGVNTVRLDVSAVANSRRAPGRHPQRRRRGRVGAPGRHPLRPRRHAPAGADVRQLPRRQLPQGPLVWLQPAFDPSCDGADADRNRCISWSAWRAEQRALVHAIRSGGHALADPALDAAALGRPAPARALPPDRQGIIYGVHFHGGPRTKLTSPTGSASARSSPARARSSSRSSSTTSRASARAAASTAPGWSDDFTAFVANWTINRGGDGAIGAAWTRYGPDAMRARHGSEPLDASARSTPRASSR